MSVCKEKDVSGWGIANTKMQVDRFEFDKSKYPAVTANQKNASVFVPLTVTAWNCFTAKEWHWAQTCVGSITSTSTFIPLPTPPLHFRSDSRAMERTLIACDGWSHGQKPSSAQQLTWKKEG